MACDYLKFPVVSGNVSLYNETKKKPIFPTPVIGGVGLINKTENIKGFKINFDDKIFIIGDSYGHLELSEYNRICGNNDGTPPLLNLKMEYKNGMFVKKFLKDYGNLVTGCHDISDGGLLLALAELCISNKKGMKIKLPKNTKKLKEWFFGEDQSRYLLVLNSVDDLKRIAKKNKVKISEVAIVENTDKFIVEDNFKIPIKKLIKYNNSWYKKFVDI